MQIAICVTSQEQGDAINAHVNLLPDSGEFDDLVNEHFAKLKKSEQE